MTAMTAAMERIKEIEKEGMTCPSCEWPECTADRKLLFKAFRVMRGIAMDNMEGPRTMRERYIDRELELRMERD